MTILVYTVMDPEAPASCKFAAGNLPEGAANPNWMCTGASPAEAREKMANFLAPKKRVKDIENVNVYPGEPEPEAAADFEDEVL
jgi:hypothetical protein